jgi:hypothetical protein
LRDDFHCFRPFTFTIPDWCYDVLCLLGFAALHVQF